MDNAHMKPNRYLKWANARKTFAAIQSHLEKGGRIMVATCTRATVYTSKHATLFKCGKDSVYVARGKHWDSLAFTPIKFI